MATEAKLKTNANYLSKFKTLSIRIPQEDFPALEEAAAEHGESPSRYILEAVRLRMERDAARSATAAAEYQAAARLAAPPVQRPAAPSLDEQSAVIRTISDKEQRKAAMIAALRGE